MAQPDHVELETLAYIEWFNHRRLDSEIEAKVVDRGAGDLRVERPSVQ